jgi:hypothetical protein
MRGGELEETYDKSEGTRGMTPEWIESGSGVKPTIAWTTGTESEIVATAYAREPKIAYIADESGSIYAIDQHGDIITVTRGFRNLDRLDWSDDGSSGAIVTNGEEVSRLDARLKSVWSANLPGQVLSIALDPFGHHLAISMATYKTFVMNWRNKRVAQFETVRPLRYMRFNPAEQQIIASADQGHLCCHDIRGEEIWREQVFSNVGDLRITGDASTILVAGYNHGVQLYDSEGSHRGSYMVEGTPKFADTTFAPENVAVATIEGHLYWLDSDGEMKWATEIADEIIGLHCEPLGNGLLVATKTGALHKLEW